MTIEVSTPAERREVFALAHGLSPREREVLGHLATGADSRTMAQALVLSEHTVNDHVRAVLAKCDAPDPRRPDVADRRRLNWGCVGLGLVWGCVRQPEVPALRAGAGLADRRRRVAGDCSQHGWVTLPAPRRALSVAASPGPPFRHAAPSLRHHWRREVVGRVSAQR